MLVEPVFDPPYHAVLKKGKEKCVSEQALPKFKLLPK
jgi:hypothetical protein